MLSEIKQKTILVATLNWGLGHTTRCIPLIRALCKENKILIASDGAAGELLKEEFPDLNYINLPSYNIKYYEYSMLLNILLQIPKIVWAIIREHLLLKKIIEKSGVSMVLSDNRFGLWNRNVHSVFITHQLFIRAGIFSRLVKKINHWFIAQYNECWVPDYENESDSLSGELSHGNSISAKVKYIGPLSRFEKQETVGKFKYDLAVLLSGPEPGRTVFENIILDQLKILNKECMLIRGIVDKENIPESYTNVEVKNYSSTSQLLQIISESKIILCRSGYSSIMDLEVLGKKAILVPTPGQTEQEYLAFFNSTKKNFLVQQQEELDIENALEELV